MSTDFGERIRNRRLELGLTQQDLADRMGYKSKATINKIEMGINDVVQSKVVAFAETLDTTASHLMGWDILNEACAEYSTKKRHLIPVIGRVQAGIPIEAVENIIGHEEISEKMAQCGEYFALKIQGDSMQPRVMEGDIVIVRKQSDIESGEVAIVMVNADDATMKKVIKHDNGITLISFNQAYLPKFFTCDEVLNLPVQIIGKVIELRGKF